MKTVLITITLLTLLSCNNNTTVKESKGIETLNKGLKAIDYHTSGMHYKIFVTSNGGIAITNVTKDSIFCQ